MKTNETMMHERLSPIGNIYALNSDLIRNCMEGVARVQAEFRAGETGNSIAFLLLHLIESRHFICRLLERPLENPFESLTDSATSIEDVRGFPEVSDMVSAWIRITSHFETALESLTDEDLSRATAARFPIGDGLVLDALTFLAQHESYHVGQIAFLRRQVGLPAMKYTRR